MRRSFRKTRWNLQESDGAVTASTPRRKLAFYAVLILAVAAVAGFGLRSIYGTAAAAAGIARTVTVERGTVQESVTASGNLSPAAAVDESFTGSGTVIAVKVAVGSRVKAGELLATLDPTTARANLESAQANLLSARATVQEAQQGGSPAQVAQNASSLASAQAQLTSDEQQLTSDQDALTTAEAQLTADQALGCPPASSSSSSGGSGSDSGGNPSGSSTDASALAATRGGPQTAPTVVTTGATSVMTTTAELEGSVSPNGGVTTYYFQYGTTTSFGHTTATGTVSAGTAVPVSASVSGLDAATSYIFRLVASNDKGARYGSPQYVTTATSSCVTDQQTVTSDQQAIANQQQAIQSQQANITAIEAGQAVDPATIAQDRAAVTQDQLTVTTDEKALQGTVLRASISGTVTAVNGAVGDVESGSSSSSSSANTGAGDNSSSSNASSSNDDSSSDSSSSSSGFLTIDNLKSLEVVAGFAEADATKIALGQPATVTLAALPSTEIAGVVSAISPTSVVTSDVVTYDETITLTNPPADVLDGMTADVSVVVDTATNVLEVPSAAVTTTGEFSTVSVSKNGKQVTTRVTVGLVGNSTTEILSGVTAGEELIEPTATVSPASTSSTSGGRGFGGGGGLFGGGGGGLG